MGTREQLRANPRVDNDDIDDIIGIAQELQTAARDEADQATVQEVKDVAAELDVDPAFIEEAIAELGRRRAEANEQAAAAQDEVQKRTAALTRGGLYAGLLVLGLLALGAVGGSLIGLSGASRVRTARHAVEQAEVQLDVVLDRQATLVPQLIALSGADASTLQSLAATVRDSTDTAERLQASRALDEEITRVLGEGGGAIDASAAQARRDLRHELAGAQNRIAVEQRRYASAVEELEFAKSSLGGRIAVGVGLVE